jgi:hypothetical protein
MLGQIPIRNLSASSDEASEKNRTKQLRQSQSSEEVTHRYQISNLV